MNVMTTAIKEKPIKHELWDRQLARYWMVFHLEKHTQVKQIQKQISILIRTVSSGSP